MTETLQAIDLQKKTLNHPVLSREEVTLLASIAQDPRNPGFQEEAIRALVEHNQKIVRSLAKKYHKPGRHLGLLDLIQAGNIGLLIAIGKFEAHRGFTLGTYATWWIRQAILREIANSGQPVRIPVHMVESMHKVRKAEKKLKTLLPTDPTEEEIAAEAEMTMKELAKVRAASFFFSDIDQPINKSAPDGGKLGEFIPDESWEREFQKVSARHDINELLAEAGLSKIEEKVIEERFFSPDQPSLTALMPVFHLSRESIRKIERKTLGKLRACNPRL